MLGVDNSKQPVGIFKKGVMQKIDVFLKTAFGFSAARFTFLATKNVRTG
jgi:hypothetical protein